MLNDLVNPGQSAVSLVNLAGVLRFYDWTLRVPSVVDRPDGITTTINPARGCVPVFKLPKPYHPRPYRPCVFNTHFDKEKPTHNLCGTENVYGASMGRTKDYFQNPGKGPLLSQLD